MALALGGVRYSFGLSVFFLSSSSLVVTPAETRCFQGALSVKTAATLKPHPSGSSFFSIKSLKASFESIGSGPAGALSYDNNHNK